MRGAATVSCAAIVLVAGCAMPWGGGGGDSPGNGTANAPAAAPAWVESGRDPHYPEGRFLLGIGIVAGADATAFARADDAARAELLKSVRVKVDQELRTVVAERQQAFGEHEMVISSQDISNDTVTRVQASLEGARIADRWIDRTRGYVHALAVLDRAQAAAILDEKIATARARADEAMGQAASHLASDDAWGALEEAVAARQSVREATALCVDRLAVAGSAGEGVPRDALLALERRAADALRSVRMGFWSGARIDDAPSPANPAQDAVAQVLRARGIPLVDAGGSLGGGSYADLRATAPASLRSRAGGVPVLLLCELRARRLSQGTLAGRPVHFYVCGADLVLLDLASGRILQTLAFEGGEETKAGRMDPRAAASESLRLGADLLAARLDEQMSALLRE